MRSPILAFAIALAAGGVALAQSPPAQSPPTQSPSNTEAPEVDLNEAIRNSPAANTGVPSASAVDADLGARLLADDRRLTQLQSGILVKSNAKLKAIHPASTPPRLALPMPFHKKGRKPAPDETVDAQAEASGEKPPSKPFSLRPR